MALSGLGAAVTMVFAYDFGRYFAFLFSGEIIMAFFFISEEGLQLRVNELTFGEIIRGQEQRTLPILPVAICMFYILYGLLNATPTGEMTQKILDFFKIIQK